MYELLVYNQNDLPKKWFYQIISFLRINFTEGFVGGLQFRNWISDPEFNPVDILIVAKDDILVSHAEVLSKVIVHNNQEYRFYGLSGVMTYPAFQGQGYGKKIVQAGTDYILAQENADVGLITCEDHKVGFYQKCGWDFVDIKLQYGDKGNPYVASSEHVALRYISDKAKKNRHGFEMIPIYFGGDPW